MNRIVNKSNRVKKCIRCRKNIYSFERRWELKHGKSKHLQCSQPFKTIIVADVEALKI
jgi:hypothetical protein